MYDNWNNYSIFYFVVDFLIFSYAYSKALKYSALELGIKIMSSKIVVILKQCRMSALSCLIIKQNVLVRVKFA